MADEILVKGASASLTAADSTVTIVTTTHTMGQSPSGPFAAVAGSEMLLESDIDASLATYSTVYSTASYPIPGQLLYESLSSVDGLAELMKKNDDNIALKSTTGTFACSPAAPASIVKPGPVTEFDTATAYDIDFSFTDAGQTLAKSA